MNSDSIIDLQIFKALKEDMGEDFVGELLQAYYDEVPQLLSELKRALADQDSHSFQRAAHSIKSTSISVGALQFGMQARELEMIGKAGNLDGVSKKVEALASGYEIVRQALEELSHG